MAKPRLILWLLLIVGALALVGQAVPLYTDWLWFQEVGYAGVFVTILSLRGWLFIGVGLGTFLFLYGNLQFAARTAQPDVYWELEDQLGLPGRVVLEPLIRRLLLPVLAVISFFSGVSASGNWETVLEYFNATPFDTTDPLFNRDLSFYVFTLPFWRLLYGWAMLLLTATMGLGPPPPPPPPPAPGGGGPALLPPRGGLGAPPRGPPPPGGPRTPPLPLGAGSAEAQPH